MISPRIDLTIKSDGNEHSHLCVERIACSPICRVVYYSPKLGQPVEIQTDIGHASPEYVAAVGLLSIIRAMQLDKTEVTA